MFSKMYNPYSLEGKTVLVTGASSGIGQATAIECSRMGAHVIITGRNEQRLEETLKSLDGESHNMIVADLTITDDLKRIVETVGRIDGLVLCAGKPLTRPIPFCSRDEFNNVFEINFFSTVELMRLLLKKKNIGKGSSIVFVSSIGGTRAYGVGNGVYAASKSAIDAIMKTTAKEMGPKNIRVNSVNPGMVNTKLIHGGTISEEQLQADQKLYPLHRYGEPKEIAWGIVYLLSDASSWVTGHRLVIDGGLTI